MSGIQNVDILRNSAGTGPVSLDKGVTIPNRVKTLTDASYTITDTDGYEVILSNNTGAQTVTLPSPSTNTGRILDIHKFAASTGALTISTAASIDGDSTRVLTAVRSWMRLASDGSNWTVIGCREVATSFATAANYTVNGTNYNAVTLTLTPGQWLIHGLLAMNTNGTTGNYITGFISTTSAGLDANTTGLSLEFAANAFPANKTTRLTLGSRVLAVTTNTSIYLVTQATGASANTISYTSDTNLITDRLR